MNYCIVESRDWIPSRSWPIVFNGTLAECRAHLAAHDAPSDMAWVTADGFRYTRGADLLERHICKAWWAEAEEECVIKNPR